MKRLLLLALLVSCSKVAIQPETNTGSTTEHHRFGFGHTQRIIFTAATTTWTAPGGTTHAWVCGCGGGGGAGGGGDGYDVAAPGGGGAGGGGARWSCTTVAVVPGTAYVVSVGAGGTGGGHGYPGSSGSAGYDSFFYVSPSGSALVTFPGASGAQGGPTPEGVLANGGWYFGLGQPSNLTPRTSIFDGASFKWPNVGGKGGSASTLASSGVPGMQSFGVATPTVWLGGNNGGSNTNSPDGGGGGAGALGPGANGAPGATVSGGNGSNGSSAGSNTCAGGGGGSGGGGNAGTFGGNGGNGGSGEIMIEF